MTRHHVCGRWRRFFVNTPRKAMRIAGWVLLGIIGAGVLIATFAAVFGLLVQWLWNTVVARALGAPQITYWQAVGLIILSRLLFGGLGAGSRAVHPPRRPRPTARDGNVPPLPCPVDDYERYWQEEGRAAFAAYLQRQEQARQQVE